MNEIRVSLTWDDNFAEEIIKAAESGIRDGLEYVLSEAQDAITDMDAFDTGTMMRSGTVRVYRRSLDIEGVISFNTPYAVSVHEGTGIYGPEGKPIEIEAINKKVLAVPYDKWIKSAQKQSRSNWLHPYGSGKLPMLSKDGRFVILGKKVTIKGMKGRKFLERPFEENKEKVLKLIRLRVAETLKAK